jgi:hypothetical protein
MVELARRADAICARKIPQWLKHPLLILIGFLASIHPARACDGSLPPLSTLALQKALVESLHAHTRGVQEEERVGQRSMFEVMEAEEEYAEEQETLRAMEACTAAGNGSPRRKVSQARVKSASDYLATLKSWQTATEDRFQVGEVTRTDVALVNALAIRAEIRLTTLKKEAGK